MRRLWVSFPILCLSFLAMPGVGAAQSTQKPPICEQAEFHQFDFWLGNWTVSSPESKKAADVTVNAILGGCGLSENWTAASTNGENGLGISTYNQATRKWEYLWIASNGYTSFWAGEFEGKTMGFDPAQPAPGAAAVRRFNMTLLADGRIQEQALFSNDEGKTWKVQYTYFWDRKS